MNTPVRHSEYTPAIQYGDPRPGSRIIFRDAPASTIERLPTLPLDKLQNTDADGAFNVATGEALAAGAGGAFDHTSSVDRALGDGMRLFTYAGSLLVIMLGVGLWLEWGDPLAGGLLGGIGALLFLAAATLHAVSWRHSNGGVARHKVNTLARMHRDRLESRERLARDLADAWLEMVSAQLEHERQIERDRARNGK